MTAIFFRINGYQQLNTFADSQQSKSLAQAGNG
jgi:hypothetical protein